MNAQNQGNVNMSPDLINAGFELVGGVFVAMSIREVLRTHSTEGVHWSTVLFFTSWGCWNLFYYPHLDQPASTLGAVGVALTNAIWLFLIWKYRKPEKV